MVKESSPDIGLMFALNDAVAVVITAAAVTVKVCVTTLLTYSTLKWTIDAWNLENDMYCCQ